MKKLILFSFVLILSSYFSAFGQSGVEMVLTKKEYKTFAEAKPNAVNQVVDGDPLWLYVKFDGTLAKYAYKTPYADNDGNINYIIFTEIGPRGEETSYDNASLIFKKDELSLTELKISLAPGVAGRNKSLSIFLNTVGGGQPGVWNNEIRISNNPNLNRRNGDYLAKVAVVCDVSDGLAKYRAMDNQYAAIVSKGTADDNKLPAPGTYVNAALKSQILSKLKAAGVVPTKFFFSSNEWEEYSDSQTDVKQNRKVYAAYTYKKGAECLSGIAEVVQNYSYVSASYGATNIILRKDFPINCSL